MLRLKIRLLFVLITVWKISTLKRLQDAAENEVLLIYPDRTDLLEKAAKTHIAHQIVERACRLVRGKGLSS